jgi:hypothetical protein
MPRPGWCGGDVVAGVVWRRLGDAAAGVVRRRLGDAVAGVVRRRLGDAAAGGGAAAAGRCAVYWAGPQAFCFVQEDDAPDPGAIHMTPSFRALFSRV